jgi:hypothetical protein
MSKRRKVRVHDYGGRRSTKKGSMQYAIHRTQGHSRKFAYEACVYVGSAERRTGRVANAGHDCGYGPAPRRALAAAMKKLASTLIKRSSAFRGHR